MEEVGAWEIRWEAAIRNVGWEVNKLLEGIRLEDMEVCSRGSGFGGNVEISLSF